MWMTTEWESVHSEHTLTYITASSSSSSSHFNLSEWQRERHTERESYLSPGGQRSSWRTARNNTDTERWREDGQTDRQEDGGRDGQICFLSKLKNGKRNEPYLGCLTSGAPDLEGKNRNKRKKWKKKKVIKRHGKKASIVTTLDCSLWQTSRGTLGCRRSTQSKTGKERERERWGGRKKEKRRGREKARERAMLS